MRLQSISDRIDFCASFEERIRHLSVTCMQTQEITTKAKEDIYETFERMRVDNHNSLIKVVKCEERLESTIKDNQFWL